MYSGSTLILAGLVLIVMCVAVSAASKRPGAAWNYYHFDGRGFVAGQPPDGGPFLAVRDHVLPVEMSRAVKIEAVSLPKNKGAIAGICYIQSSGGKLEGGRGYAPCPRTTITISSGNTVVTSMLSDENGYFVAILAAGSYRVGSGAFAVEALVEKGTTVLVPLRAGKRMVD
ncbi:MAG: hypothetical protein H7X83_01600 [Verrucomicrobia bacterium]|nr:hypothetical protein [Deltaproteobacteria bacterium]